MRLTFVIPTKERPAELAVCVRSIAEQVAEQDVRIVIVADAADEATQAVIEGLSIEFTCVSWSAKTVIRDYSDSFRDMFRVACDSDWIWTFGDDDKLLPGALASIFALITDTDLDFVHVAEVKRCSGTKGLYRGTLWNLCNSFGWLEMTGFITGNVMRGSVAREIAEVAHWKQYARSSFVHSCAMLEVLKDRMCALWDVPLVDTQNENQTQECVNRWIAENIGPRYLFVADALELMYEEGVLTQKVKRNFFRYTNIMLWSRHLHYYVYDWINNKVINPAALWDPLLKMLTFLDDAKYAESVHIEIESLRGQIILLGYLEAEVSSINDSVKAIGDLHGEARYPWSYVIPREAL